MIIDVNQTTADMKNDFEILYNGARKYTATLPFITVSGAFNLDNLKKIKVFDIENNLKFISEYNYIENQIEEVIPLKYLATKSQKFCQIKFINNTDGSEIYIFFAMEAVWDGKFIIKLNDKIYKGYSIEDGYIRHVCIYDDETQIAELLKPNVLIDGKDTYRTYLKDEYANLSDAIVMLSLYLDRTEYSSSYIKNKSISYEKKFSYSKANTYYNPNWIKENFECTDYFNQIDGLVNEVKQKIKNTAKSIFLAFGIVMALVIIAVLILTTVLL